MTNIYTMLTYLASSLCKADYTMSEVMKKASKESYGRNAREKLSTIGNVFVTKREISTHEAMKPVLSLPVRTSNIAVIYIYNEQKKKEKKKRKLNQNAENFTIILGKYENRLDNSEQLCLANLAFMYEYVEKSKDEQQGTEYIKSYTRSVSYVDEDYEKKRKLFNSKMD